MLRILRKKSIHSLGLLVCVMTVLACGANTGTGAPSSPPHGPGTDPPFLNCTPGDSIASDDPCVLCTCSEGGIAVCEPREVGSACLPIDCCVQGAVCSTCANPEDCGTSGLTCGGGVRPDCVSENACMEGAPVCVDSQCECTYGPAADGTSCDADSVDCTVNDVCVAGTCVAGDAADIDDGNPCTAGVCVKGEAVQKALGGPCSDGDPCTVGDTCTLAQCVPSDLKDCPPKACTQSAWCDSAAGGCAYEPEPDGTPCVAAGDVCASTGICQAGTCVGTGAANCDDSNACTTDTCDPASGCQNTANPPCDDGTWCTKVTCDPELGCIVVLQDVCDDADPCTVDECSADMGCQYTVLPDCGTPDGMSWNPMDKQKNIVLSNDNLTATVLKDSLNDTVRATSGKDYGSWYWEISLEASSGGSYNGVCVADETLWLEISPGCSEPGVNYERDGSTCGQGSNPFLTFASYGQGDVVGVALDANAALVYFHVNGVWQNGADPAQGTGALPLGLPGGTAWFPCINLSQGDVYTANFGQLPFVHSPPMGFNAIAL